eukprot:jgi/Botrbrau1/9102/Bobra.0305s0009.1
MSVEPEDPCAPNRENSRGSADLGAEVLYPSFSAFTGIETNEVDETIIRRKIDRHLIPCFFTLAVCCYLDRSSLAFGSLQLMKDLSFSKTVYGIGAGIFFVGYATFQVPSNVVLARVGAPTWLAVLMGCWGLVDAAQAAIRTPLHFYILRFLLGVAECGAFPGMWYHLHLFYTSEQLGVAYSAVASATALSQVVGGPLAAGILALDGLAGLRGWQLLFIAQGLPTIALAVFIKLYLAESPGEARFLSTAERDCLLKAKAAASGEPPSTSQASGSPHRPSVDWKSAAEVCQNWRVWYLGLVWFLVDASQYGVLFWCPLLLQALLEGDFNGGPSPHQQTDSGWDEIWQDVKLSAMSAFIFVPAAASMILNAFLARAARERRWHSALPVAMGGAFLGSLPLVVRLLGSVAAFFTLMLAASGIWAIHGPFFSWPAVFLKGSEAAAGIALINTLGACGGVLGPFLIGRLADATGGSYALPMATLAVMDILAATLLICFQEPPQSLIYLEPLPAAEEPDAPCPREIILYSVAEGMESPFPEGGGGGNRYSPEVCSNNLTPNAKDSGNGYRSDEEERWPDPTRTGVRDSAPGEGKEEVARLLDPEVSGRSDAS